MSRFSNSPLSYILSLGLVVLGCSSSDDGAGGSGATGTSSATGTGGSSATGTGGSSATGTGGADGTGGSTAEDLVMTEADFDCILGWTKVRRFRVTNKLGHEAETLAVANTPGSSDYPVGTVIQLIPTEAMVKRQKGFNEASNDWEFFFLGVSDAGTTIEARGTTDVVNGFGANCFNCHVKAEPKWDLVCEQDHGCDTIPVTAEQIEATQNGDPRCP